ncbi:thaumatin-like protein 1b [Canna indica]|uniref:Thaumatin-like protein 1b n=1 Tax=Canna indica TaxID=4628 RepID=A0AAQ3KLF2_9LILI|nr:thaumatin-like protein 1b [Canna indica]
MDGFVAAIFAALVVFFYLAESSAATFTLTNNCEFTVWPGVLSNAGGAALSTTGFALDPGQTKSLDAPAAWSGRFWGRTLCAADSAGRFSCGTGDCGSGEVECSGGGAAPPATLAEFTLDGGEDAGGMDYYDVSLVDGYNLPMLVAPQSGGSGCGATGCAADVNGVCPSDLKVVARSSGGGGGDGAACKSACEAFGSPEYCCSGAYSNPETCKPSSYSEMFKRACPRAYSYAFDDATSTFTCAAAAGYLITFCPSAASQKSSGQNPEAASRQPLNGSGDGGAVMFFSSGSDVSPPSKGQTGRLAAATCLTILAFSSWLL